MIEAQELLKSVKPVIWLFCGDSITKGECHTSGYRDYTEIFRERLGEAGRVEDVVINTARGGAGIDYLYSRVDERVLRFHPDAVFLMFGTNDSIHGENGRTIFLSTYRKTVELIKKSGIAHIVLQTSIPVAPLNPERFDPGDWPLNKMEGMIARLENLDNYFEDVRKLAKEMGLQFVDHWKIWKSIRTAYRLKLTEGYIHPNEYGHRLIAYTIFKEMGLWDENSMTCRLYIPLLKSQWKN